MSLKTRFLVMAAGLLLVFGATLLLLRRGERRGVEAAWLEAREENRRHIGRMIEFNSIALRQLARDYGHGDLAARLAGAAQARPEAVWQEVAAAHGADAVWLLRPDGATERVVTTSDAEPALLPSDLHGSLRAGGHFFAEIGGVLWEFVSASRPATEGEGWLLAGRRWSEDRVAELAQALGCTVRLETVEDAAAGSAGGSELVVERPLRDARGDVVRLLRATRADPVAPPGLSTDGALIRLLVGFGVLLLAALGLAVHRWVLRPLDRIGESLVRESPAPLERFEEGEEINRLARLAAESFEQKARLRREVEERRQAEARLQTAQEDLRQSIEVRSRLARNLHDTVIQAIYATGLGLESARGELAADPAAAAARLAHCRANLNDTIREVRGFINDLEPESGRRQSFAQALRSLAFTMQSLWVAAIEVELDERVAARFSVTQETHVLQIVREAISNALRHGEASRVRIVLQPDADGRNALLKVQDNGRGFDAAHRTGTGHGLVNMTNRAREMDGSLRLQTEPGAGTTLVLRIPFAPAP